MRNFFGILGVVLFGFGILGGLISNSYTNPVVAFHFIVGIVFIASWALRSGASTIGDAKQIISGRTTRYGTHAVVYTVLFLAIIGAGNWIANRNNKKIDLTEQGVYSLAPQSKELIKNLKSNLKIVAFKGLSEDDEQIQDLIARYKDQNPSLVTTEIVDPRANPARVKQFEMKQGNLLYLEYSSGDKKSVSRINEATEESLSNAILKLTRGASKKIYVLAGHDEGDIEDAKAGGFKAAKLALEDENLSVAPLILAQAGQVPSDAAALIVFSSKKTIPEVEQTLIVKYVNEGGRLLLAADPQDSGDTAKIAQNFGIKVNKDIVLDQIQKLFSGPQIGAQPIVTDYDSSSPITKNFTKQNITIFTMSSSLSKGDAVSKQAQYSEIIKSSSAAWGETNLTDLLNEANPTATLDSSDNKGPVVMGMTFETPIESKQSDSQSPSNKDVDIKQLARVVVFGSSSWLANEGLGAYSNRDLFINSVNWLVGEEGGYTIRAGSIRASYAPIPQATFILLMLCSFIIPEILLLVGLWIWWNRKN
jgi:ABC-type uncharacterized transport system involved in gliding motility auxiliary subunit